MNFEEEKVVLQKTSCFITSDKNIKYKLEFSVFNNNIIELILYSTNHVPSKKFFLSCTLEELSK